MGVRLYNLMRFVSCLVLGDAPAFGQVNRSITAGAGGPEACRSIQAGWTSGTRKLERRQFRLCRRRLGCTMIIANGSRFVTLVGQLEWAPLRQRSIVMRR